MRKLLNFLTLGLLFLASNSSAQDATSTPKYVRYKTANQSLESQLKFKPIKGQVIADSLFDRKLDSTLNLVSGFAYKDGKAAKTSAVVDDKSLTANINLLDKYYNTLQFSASAATEEKFAELFKDGSYNKTLSIGFNYNYFPSGNSACADEDAHTKLKAKIDKANNYFDLLDATDDMTFKLERLIKHYNDNYKKLNALDKNNVDDKKAFADIPDVKKIEGLFKNQFSKISDLGSSDIYTAAQEIEKNKAEIIKNYRLQRRLDSINNLQLHQKFNVVLFNWYSFGAKFNSAKYKVFNPTGLAADSFMDNVYDNFISVTGSFNLMLKTEGINYYLAPGLGASFNTYNFESDSLKTANVPKGTRTATNPNNNPVIQTLTEYKQIYYYPATPDRLLKWTYQLPLVIYFNKLKFGLDLAYTGAYSDKVVKSEGRIGVFIPFGLGETAVTIEPLLRFKDLWTNSTDPLLKKRATIGISAAFSLPKFIEK